MAATIERLAAAPAELEAMLARVPRDRWTERVTEDGFSLVEHACHLRDLERDGYLVRIRRILEEESPRLEAFDGAAVARKRRYQDQDAKVAAQQFAGARYEVVTLLAAATPRELEREGVFAEAPITLADLARAILEHDQEHRDQMAALARMLEDPGWR
jgi:hypothetical protein